MATEYKSIGKYLLEKKLITESQLKEAMEESKKTNRKIGEVLVKKGFVTEEDVTKVLGEQLGFTFLDLSSYQIDTKVLSFIPAEVATKLQVIPIFKV